jgi:hypothetical protein
VNEGGFGFKVPGNFMERINVVKERVEEIREMIKEIVT